MPLIDTAIRTEKPDAKQRKLFDEKGLFLIVTPAGGKWWRFKYRLGGKEKLLSLATYPEVSLKDARERRDEARKLVANDFDPSENRNAAKAGQAERAANSYEVVARGWYSKNATAWVASHGDRIIRRLERDTFPWLGGNPVAEITAPQLLQIIRRIED